MRMIKKVTVSGRVQGVGYRNFVYRHAVALGIRGTVRNLYNGDVEVVFEDKNEVTANIFIDELKNGPRLALVEEINIEDVTFEYSDDFNGFEIID